MRIKDYSIASYELLASGKSPDSVIAGLKTTLTQRRSMRLYPAILRDLLNQLIRHKKSKTITFLLAREADHAAYTTRIETVKKELGEDEISIQINPNIIGGYVAEVNNTKIDASYKSQLLTLYRSLIS